MGQHKPKLILAGGGHAHLGVLAHFIRNGAPDADIILISNRAQTAYSGLLPAWMAGTIPAEDMFIDSAALAERAGVRFVCDAVVAMDAATQVLTTASGATFAYDYASLAIGGENDTRDFAPLGDRLLTVRPIESFMQQWNDAMDSAMAKGVLRLIIVGGGAGGVELALGAVAAARRADIAQDIGLVMEQDAFLSGHAAGVQRRALALLQQKGVAIQYGRAVGHGDGVCLSDGRILSTDHVIVATGSRAPQWMAASGLAADPDGFVSIGADLRSLSHPHIFAAGDIVNRADRPLPRSGVHAVKAGPVLALNIIAAVCGGAMRTYDPPSATLYLLSSGDKKALLSYGQWTGLGRIYYWLKRAIDTRFIRRYAAMARL